jgi:hypothetical protein
MSLTNETSVVDGQDFRPLIRDAARMLMDAALQAIQADPHQWSERPCQTCKAVSALAGRAFGCYLYAQQRKAR